MLARWLLVVALLQAAVARADENVELGAAHFRTGATYFAQGEYERALVEFKAAERFTPRPELDFNIARTYERMGDAAHAVQYYRKYLELRPDASDRAETEEALTRLSRRVCSLKVTSGPDVAVRLDGEPVQLPADGVLAVTAGPHVLSATRAGFLPREVPVRAVAGQALDVDVTLAVAVQKSAPQQPAPAPPKKRRWPLWVGIGAGAAALAVIVIGVGVGVGVSQNPAPDYGFAGRNCLPDCPVVDLR